MYFLRCQVKLANDMMIDGVGDIVEGSLKLQGDINVLVKWVKKL